MLRTRLIYNPTAGREKLEKMLPSILKELEEAGYETSCKSTTGKWDAAEEAKMAAERGFDVVIAAGGDGTIHEVVNGLAQSARSPKMGILPAGTTNDLSRALKIPRNLFEACRVITKGKTSTIDIGKYNDRYFINVAAAGHVAEVTTQAPSLLKTMVGPIAYYASAIEQWGKLNQPFSVQLQSDELVKEEELLALIITNSVSVGGFEKLAPSAQLNDGLFDVILIHKGSIPDLLQVAALILKGEHIHDPRITYFQTRSLQINTSYPLHINLDGEWGGKLKGTFKVVPKFVEVFCP